MRVALACLFLGGLFFLPIGLPPSQAQDKGEKPADKYIEDRNFQTPYYPLKVGNRWTYKAGTQLVVIEVEKSEMILRPTKTRVRERMPSYVLKITSGDKTQREQVVVLADGVYRLQSANKEIQPPACFLKLPLKPGDSWEVNSTSENATMKGTFVGGEAAVQVKAGSFQAITVTSKDFVVGTQPEAIETWYVPEVGMVKQRVQIGDFQSLLELEKFQPAPSSP